MSLLIRVASLGFCLLLVTVTHAARAQIESSSSLVADFSLIFHAQSDAAASPLHYQGAVPGGNLGWYRLRPRSRLELKTGFASGDLTSDISKNNIPREEAYLTFLDTRYLRRVGGLYEDRLDLSAGAQLGLYVPFRRHHYVENGSELFGDLMASVSVAGGWDFQWSTLRIGQRLAVPILGIVMRTPYEGLKSLPPVKLSHIGELNGFQHSLFAERTLSRRIGIRAALHTTLLRHPEPREIRLISHRLDLGLVLRWGQS